MPITFTLLIFNHDDYVTLFLIPNHAISETQRETLSVSHAVFMHYVDGLPTSAAEAASVRAIESAVTPSDPRLPRRENDDPAWFNIWGAFATAAEREPPIVDTLITHVYRCGNARDEQHTFERPKPAPVAASHACPKHQPPTCKTDIDDGVCGKSVIRGLLVCADHAPKEVLVALVGIQARMLDARTGSDASTNRN